MIKIEWTENAIKDLEKIDKTIIKRILKKISWLSDNFEMVTPEPLTGNFKGTYKLRVGDWRIIYTIEYNAILIQFVGHRKEIYKM